MTGVPLEGLTILQATAVSTGEPFTMDRIGILTGVDMVAAHGDPWILMSHESIHRFPDMCGKCGMEELAPCPGSCTDLSLCNGWLYSILS